MKTTFECKQCGKCCTNLEESAGSSPGGLLLTPEESVIFTGDAARDVHPTVGYYAPGSDDFVIIYYGMINTVCPLYDNGCTVYNDRPLVCRRYPLGNDICHANRDCPSVVNDCVLFDDVVTDAMFDLSDRTDGIAAGIPRGADIYIYLPMTDTWTFTGSKS